MSKRAMLAAKGSSEWIERLTHQAEADAEDVEMIRKIIFSEKD